MTVKIHSVFDVEGKNEHVLFHCPGCDRIHTVPVQRTKPVDAQHWFYNGNPEKPSLEPSLRIMRADHSTECHLVLTDGVIAYCADTAHKFVNQSVPIEAFEWPPPDNA